MAQALLDIPGQRRRLMAMFAVCVVAFIVAAAAMVGHAVFRFPWMLPVVVAAVLTGFGAQGWFILGWLKASKAGGGQ